MNAVLLIVGAVIALVGGVWILIKAFRESIIWGIGSLLFWPVQIVFVLMHWDDTKKPFFISVAGGVLMLVAFSQMPKAAPQATQQASAVGGPTTTTHASFESVMKSIPQEEPVARRPAPQPAPRPAADEPAVSLVEKVYADNKTKTYYTKDCATHPENAYPMSKSLAVSQGYKPAVCK